VREPSQEPEWHLEYRDPPPSEPVGELELWASSAEPEEVSASLVFQGPAVDPDTITQLLGIGPTVDKRTGTRGTKVLVPVTDGFWRLSGERVRDSSVEAQILILLQRLPPSGGVWEQLRPLGGELFCGLFLQVWNRECHLSPTVLRAALERHLLLRLDIYYEGPNPAVDANDEDFV